MSSTHDPSEPDATSPTAHFRREVVLDHFEEAWRGGKRPQLSDYVAQVPLAQREGLLRELLRLDSDYRREAGETPQPSDYTALLPQHRTVILEVLSCKAEVGVPSKAMGSTDTETGAGSGKSVAQESTVVPQHSKAQEISTAQIGDYQILSEIARGGMGVVYKARHRTLGRLAAVKVIKSGQLADDAEVQRFRIEAQAAAGLDHPGIVPVFEVGCQDGQHYMALAYIDGQSLWQLVKEAPLPPREAARMIQQVAEAIQYAHDRGIIHRDLKPQNILVTNEGQPKVTDFGLAKKQAGDSSLTGTGQVLGTPSYMPPEQVSGKKKDQQIGPLADVYSLGATLYCLLTGRPPFQAASPIDTMLQVLEQEPVSPRKLNPAIPKDLETICLKCLEKETSRRYLDARALADDLGRYWNHEPVVARPTGAIERAGRWCHRKPMAAGLLASTMTLVLLSLVGLWYRNQYAAVADRLTTAEAVKRISEFHASLNHIREAIANPRHGWTWDAERELARAGELAPPDAERHELATLLAEVISRADVRRVGTVATDTAAGALAFSPDGLRLAVAERKHALSCSVTVYSVASREKIASYSFSTVDSSWAKLFGGERRYQDGARSLAWSPDGSWLVVGTRFGKLIRWDTSTEDPKGIGWQAHKAAVADIRFSPDGSLLYSCANELKQWHAGSDWSERPTVSNEIHSFALSPDGSTLACYAADKDFASVVDVVTLEDLKPWQREPFASLAFSPNGRFVAGSRDGGRQIAIRDARSGQDVIAWVLRQDDELYQIETLSFSADGSVVIGLDRERRLLHFWETATGRELMPPIASADSGVRFAVDRQFGHIAITNLEGSELVELYEWRSPPALMTIGTSGQVRGIDFSPDSTRLAVVAATESVGSDGGDPRWIELSEWSFSTTALIRATRASHQRRWQPLPPSSTAWHPSGDRIAWFAEWCGLMISPAEGSSEPTHILPLPDQTPPIEIPAAEVVSPQQSVRANESQATNRPIVVTETKPGEPAGRIVLNLKDLPLAKHREGWMLVASARARRTGTGAGIFEVGHVNPELADGGRRTQLFSLDAAPSSDFQFYGLALLTSHDDGRDERYGIVGAVAELTTSALTLAVDRVYLVPLAIHRSEATAGGSRPFAFGQIMWSPDGKRLWGLVEDQKRLVSWDADSLSVIANWNSPLDEVTTGTSNVHAFAAGNSWIICGGKNGIVTVVPSGQGFLEPEARFAGPGGSVRAAAIDPSEKWMIIGTQTGQVQIRTIPSGEVLADIPGHRLSVQAIALSKDGTLLATAGDEGIVRLFRVDGPSSVTPIVNLNGRSGSLSHIHFSPNGRYVAAAARNARQVHLWDLSRLHP